MTKELDKKKAKLAGKMAKVKLGQDKINNFAYKIEDHRGNLLEEGGSEKGKAALRDK